MITVQGPDSEQREERLNRMVLLHEKYLLRLCCLYLRDVALAQDAVQECFLKAYRSLDRFRGESSEKTWLTKIAVNVCRDLSKSSWLRHVDFRVSLEDLQLSSPPPSAEHAALTEAIMNLPRKYREAVLLHYYEGYSVKETAEILRITSPAVTARLTRAREKLRIALEGDEKR